MALIDDLLSAAALDPNRAVIRIQTDYEPAGGPNARVFPPTYPVNAGDEHPYVVEERLRDGQTTTAVLLDSTPSEANRVEESLLRALREGRIELPLISIEHDLVTLSSLEIPHRYADAYLRDSTLDGVAFDKSDLGKQMLAADAMDASALYSHDPGSLVFGAWNSHRKGRQTRFPRIYGSEIIGWQPQIGQRKAGRMDPLNLTGAVESTGEAWTYAKTQEKASARRSSGTTRLSEIGHGNIAPGDAHGGVTISGATRTATISFAALDRLGFGPLDHKAKVAARATLAAYALLGDRLTFGGGSIWLRSGCELVAVDETLAWVGRGRTMTPFELSSDAAVDLFNSARSRAADAGISMDLAPITLKPNKPLSDAIEFSLTDADGD